MGCFKSHTDTGHNPPIATLLLHFSIYENDNLKGLDECFPKKYLIDTCEYEHFEIPYFINNMTHAEISCV